MQINEIFEKAKKLGLNTGNSINQIENLRTIANQIGVKEISEIEETLDKMLELKAIENLNDEPESLEEFEETELENISEINSNSRKNIADNKELNKKIEDSNSLKKSKWDKTKDNSELVRAERNRTENKINIAREKTNQILHSNKTLNEENEKLVEEATEEIGKKVAKKANKIVSKGGEVVGNAISQGFKKVINFFASNPLILAITTNVIAILIVLLILFNGYYEQEKTGYYDPECNFNQTIVELTKCGSDTKKTLTLENYIFGNTLYYTNGKNYSEETLKTLMVILKTNALSKGNYNNSSKTLYLDDCDKTYTEPASVEENELTKIETTYRTIEEVLYLSTSYTDIITKSSSKNELEFNETIIDEIETLSANMSYDKILDKIYNSNNNTSTENTQEKRNTIFIGDSRIQSMSSLNILSENNSVYSNGGGLSWFTGTSIISDSNCSSNAINCINNKKTSNENIVIWLGLNDIENYTQYYEKYYDLAKNEWKNNNIYIVSVGYVDEDETTLVTNEKIKIFNYNMERNISGSGIANLHYIDLGYNERSMASQISTGINYKDDFFKTVYNKINSTLNEKDLNEEKAIYKLGTYCTYYSLASSNTAYWWPLGSSNETEPNIYGGEPVSTRVTSAYGVRVHPVTGNLTVHTGIDIGADSQSPIIVVQDGTVTAVMNTCEVAENKDDPEAQCGGGYGNYVLIDHGDGISTFYAHMYTSSAKVDVGDTVVQGQKIGEVGTTGVSTGSHLHFEVRINGSASNPIEFVSSDNTRPTVTLEEIDDVEVIEDLEEEPTPEWTEEAWTEEDWESDSFTEDNWMAGDITEDDLDDDDEWIVGEWDESEWDEYDWISGTWEEGTWGNDEWISGNDYYDDEYWESSGNWSDDEWDNDNWVQDTGGDSWDSGGDNWTGGNYEVDDDGNIIDGGSYEDDGYIGGWEDDSWLGGNYEVIEGEDGSIIEVPMGGGSSGGGYSGGSSTSSGGSVGNINSIVVGESGTSSVTSIANSYWNTYVPTWLKNKFVGDGWRMVISASSLGPRYGYNFSVAGLTVYGEQTIYFDNRSSVISHSMLHELGHYIDSRYGFPSDSFGGIYNSERNRYSSPMCGSYCKTSGVREYFAEIFADIVLNGSRCRSEVPESYNFVSNYIG